MIWIASFSPRSEYSLRLQSAYLCFQTTQLLTHHTFDMNTPRSFLAGFLVLRLAAAAFEAVLLVSTYGSMAEAHQGTVDFNRDVRPILSDKCLRCHGPDAAAREADLRLDTQASATSVRDGRAAIVPRSAENSEMIRRVTSTDEADRMPPPTSGVSLTATEIETLKRWIAQGATWSAAWAYVPPRHHAVVEVANRTWPRNWIDRFILNRLESVQLAPSPEADKTTLVRRLSIDLTGLPPSRQEVESFLADDDQDAYEKLVDRLFASSHFGERMATYWLDLVRYADTVGYHGDQEQHVFPYRDYVIQAFNHNLPFDQFTREQLAGDLLPQATVQQHIASGYNRLLQTSHEGGVQPKEYLAIYGADRVRNLSAVWLGGTLGCAQCHDHKFDPYTTRDFYSLQAFFADIDEARHLTNGFGLDNSPTVRHPEMEISSNEEREQLSQLETQLSNLKRALAEHSQSKAVASGPSPMSNRSDSESVSSATAPSEAELEAAIKMCTQQIAHIHQHAARTLITVAIKPREIRILPRGNWMDESGPVVEPAIPEFLGTLRIDGRRATRLDLANWLTDPQDGVGGLTARVMVNRMWSLLFGVGLARVLDDFGVQGEPPVYPDLLDNLAIEFMESGWNVQSTLKTILMSRAYRQSSAQTRELLDRDPENRLYARQSSFRYPAEVVRDSALSISGLMVSTIGGPSAKPYQPAGYYRNLSFPEREYQAHDDDRQWRRGVYMHWQRQYLHPMLKAFDAPSREECTAERPRSNTPQAALVLLNDPTFVEASRVFAARILCDEGATEGRIERLFHAATSRPPNDNELRVLEGLLAQGHEWFLENPTAANELLHVGQAPLTVDVDPIELASWTVVARAVLALHETISRN
jgi:hypothetical protein